MLATQPASSTMNWKVYFNIHREQSSTYQAFATDMKKNYVGYALLYSSVVVTSLPLGTVAVVYNLCLSILFRVASVKIAATLVESGKWKEMTELFPFNHYTRNVILGVAASFCAAPLFYGLQLGLNDLEDKLGTNYKRHQDIHRLLELVNNPGMRDLTSTLTTLLLPFFEECVFRGHLENWFTPSKKELGIVDKISKSFSSGPEEELSNSVFKDKIMPALKTSFVFGLIHTSPTQKWTNIPAFFNYTALSLVCSTLKNLTGDLWAPYIIHIVYFKDALNLHFGPEETASLAKYLTMKYKDFFVAFAKEVAKVKDL